jgi:hypothetical protein
MIAPRLVSAAIIASFLVAALPAIGSADETVQHMPVGMIS